MEFARLELADFRNYERAEVEFVPGLNLVLGDNGQGKTNLVEAVHLLCAFGSHRVSQLGPLVRQGAERAVLRASGSVRGRRVEVDAELRRVGGLRVRVNRVGIQALHGAAGGLASVLFSPEDLAVVKGGPEERRRLVDQVVAQTRPRGASERHEFERVLRQRNGALKAAQANPRALESMDVWDEQLARAGALVVRNRLEVLQMLIPRAEAHYLELAGGGKGGLGLDYRPSWAEGPAPAEVDEIRSELGRAIASSRSRDIDRGFTHTGPHRDLIDLSIDGADARTFGSQGEQRTIALALRLAERDVICSVRSEEPILLLDDVFSELDENRRARLAELILEVGQTIGTATGIQGLPVAPRKVIRVSSGKVMPGD